MEALQLATSRVNFYRIYRDLVWLFIFYLMAAETGALRKNAHQGWRHSEVLDGHYPLLSGAFKSIRRSLSRLS